MTAIRYSGSVRVSVRFCDARHVYMCGVAWTDGSSRHCKRVDVAPPAFMTTAVDSPSAIDAAACAALSCVSEDFDTVTDHAWSDDSGWVVRRIPTVIGRLALERMVRAIASGRR